MLATRPRGTPGTRGTENRWKMGKMGKMRKMEAEHEIFFSEEHRSIV